MTVRTAVEGDYDVVCRLFEASDRHNYELAPHAYRPPHAPARSRDYLTQAIAGDAGSLLVAELGGDVVGIARVAVGAQPTMTAGILAQVGYLYIDERVRRQGIGTALLEGCHGWIRAHDGRRIYLPVLAGDAVALAFFRRFDYADRADIDCLLLADIDATPDATTRDAVAQDYDAVCALHDETTQFHHDLAPHDYAKPQSPTLEPERFAYYVGADAASVLVAERDDAIVGIVQARVVPSGVYAGGRYGSVTALHVSQSCRGGGVGSALMQRCHQWFRERDVPRVQLRVIHENAGARGFYERLGYGPLFLDLARSLGDADADS
ncbi:GNAT family N-acetyltransferase [Candidatus Poribacteria bacterium]|nr:GNAT family N-acetyltransferase [Candidatus Poribacteria bacterium]MBT5537088.1 GNAT family N-acetyltransferase [Candidatus Poribacteria bacterium]MBT7096335.1 GNAT family N-acetyltransferase [Candidatus Poribacteria bacterium]MBT7804554.1 GNAT family N-acetyltransferase [Candidatus Poribacteria bacterium]